MINTEKILKIILRLSGLLLVTAFIAVFLPYKTMNIIHQYMGLGILPQTPIVDYLARSLSLFYGVHGIITLYISFNLIRFLPILKLLCYIGISMGITLFFIDVHAEMPARWTYAEAPLVISVNLLVYFLAIRLEREKGL
jgi:hypothetical protein